jgi:ZIP family zinc transporter
MDTGGGRVSGWGDLLAGPRPGIAASSHQELYAPAFAAGAMIFVVEELIPESQKGGHADLATMSLMSGFAVMMTLDVAFG